MKYVKLFESFVNDSKTINEAGIPKMYVKYMAVVKKIRELEDAQKELAQPYFKAREEGNHTAMVNQMELMKKNQAELDSYRKNLAKIEDKYINSMDYFKGE
jgi:hypothetical protein